MKLNLLKYNLSCVVYIIESSSFFQWVIQSFNFFTDFSLFWSLGRTKGSINLQPSNMHFKLFKHIACLLHIGFESRLKAQLYYTSNNRINDRDSFLVELSSPVSILAGRMSALIRKLLKFRTKRDWSLRPPVSSIIGFGWKWKENRKSLLSKWMWWRCASLG